MSMNPETVSFLPGSEYDGGQAVETISPDELTLGDVIAVTVEFDTVPDWLNNPSHENRRNSAVAPMVGRVILPLPENIGDAADTRWTPVWLAPLADTTDTDQRVTPAVVSLGNVQRNIGPAPGKTWDFYAAGSTVLHLIHRQ